MPTEQATTEAEKLVKKGFCLDSLKVNESVAKSGIMFPFMDGVSLLIAKGNTMPERRYMASLYKANQSVLDSDTPEGNELGEQLTIQAEAKYRLVGWEGALDADGNDLPYSAEKAEEYMAIEEVRTFVNARAMDPKHWRVGDPVATAGKLKK